MEIVSAQRLISVSLSQTAHSEPNIETKGEGEGLGEGGIEGKRNTPARCNAQPVWCVRPRGATKLTLHAVWFVFVCVCVSACVQNGDFLHNTPANFKGTSPAVEGFSFFSLSFALGRGKFLAEVRVSVAKLLDEFVLRSVCIATLCQTNLMKKK